MSATREAAIRVVVSPDNSAAELIVPPEFSRQMLTPELCEAMLRQAGLEIGSDVGAAVRQLLAQPAPPGQPLRGVVARAKPPRNGVDGHVEWLVEAPAEQRDPSTEGGAASYYNRSAFVIVEPGQVVGRLHRPQQGEDGRDVLGRTLAARLPKEARLKFDESLVCTADGQLIAQAQGVLIRNGDLASIRRVLEIADYVDFSTGNIDFDGDVIVGKGVRDLFTVKATGNVEVKGLIEAATILADGELLARGGFAGRERGTAHCGSIQAKYLDNIHGEVLRDLHVEREIINCELTIHGSLQAPHGAIIGGRMSITGEVHVGMLGSAAAVATEVVVGCVPRLEPLAQRLRSFVEKLTERRESLLAEQTQLQNLVGKTRATSNDKERLTELSFEISNADILLGKAGATLAKLDERIAQQRTVDVHVERRLHPGVVLTVGHDRYHIASELRGPLRITRDASGQVIYQRGEHSAGLLLQVADLELAA